MHENADTIPCYICCKGGLWCAPSNDNLWFLCVRPPPPSPPCVAAATVGPGHRLLDRPHQDGAPDGPAPRRGAPRVAGRRPWHELLLRPLEVTPTAYSLHRLLTRCPSAASVPLAHRWCIAVGCGTRSCGHCSVHHTSCGPQTGDSPICLPCAGQEQDLICPPALTPPQHCSISTASAEKHCQKGIRQKLLASLYELRLNIFPIPECIFYKKAFTPCAHGVGLRGREGVC